MFACFDALAGDDKKGEQRMPFPFAACLRPGIWGRGEDVLVHGLIEHSGTCLPAGSNFCTIGYYSSIVQMDTHEQQWDVLWLN